MAFWCRHMICLGWHVIKKAEGRDDVFSALFTFFKQCPRYIIYDFACAAGAYSLFRQYNFFKDALFLTDRLHAQQHNACSPATHTSNWANSIPELARLNTQVAESGNSGLRRIKKVVSYCNQQHAILYTGTYINIRNRIAFIKQRDSTV